MIKKLKRRIILILTSFVFIIGVSILLAINYFSYMNLKDTCYYQIERSILIPHQESNIETDIVVLVRSRTGFNIFFNDTDLSYDDVFDLVDRIQPNQRIGNIKYYYYLNLGNEIIIMDQHNLYVSFYRSIGYSITIFALIMIGFFYFASKIAKWSVHPVEEAFEKQKSFISDVSHELKTPIAIIQTNTELLQLDGSNKQLDYIAYETSRMNALITKLLQLTRIDTNPDFKKLKKENMSYIVQKAATPFETLIYEKGFHFVIFIEENINTMINDSLIEQLVTILLDNAIKHTKEDGQIELNLSTNGKKIILSVEDEGDEIPEDQREKIFDRFYRLDKSRNRKDNRYGLGLSIAKSIMEVHNGKIYATSGEGKTKFTAEFHK